jgi:hypothetical protein
VDLIDITREIVLIANGARPVTSLPDAAFAFGRAGKLRSPWDGGANGSRECAPDDRLRDAHQLRFAKVKAMGFAKSSTHAPPAVKSSGEEEP